MGRVDAEPVPVGEGGLRSVNRFSDWAKKASLRLALESLLGFRRLEAWRRALLISLTPTLRYIRATMALRWVCSLHVCVLVALLAKPGLANAACETPFSITLEPNEKTSCVKIAQFGTNSPTLNLTNDCASAATISFTTLTAQYPERANSYRCSWDSNDGDPSEACASTTLSSGDDAGSQGWWRWAGAGSGTVQIRVHVDSTPPVDDTFTATLTPDRRDGCPDGLPGCAVSRARERDVTPSLLVLTGGLLLCTMRGARRQTRAQVTTRRR